MIPKIIWQTHEESFDNLYAFQINIANTWKNLNPSWEYRYVDSVQRAIDVEKFDKILFQSYLTEPKITQADMWRYIMLYQYGGVYADMDSVCQRPLDDFINKFYNNEDIVCTKIHKYRNNMGDECIAVNNSNFAATKKSKVLNYIIEDVKFAYRMMLEKYIPGPIVPIKYMCWDSFHRNIFENKDQVLFNFDCGFHEKTYKEKFTDYEVCYNDEKTSYFKICQLNGWNIFSD